MTVYFSVNPPDINVIKQRDVQRAFLNLYILNIYFRSSENFNLPSRKKNCMLLFHCFQEELYFKLIVIFTKIRFWSVA